MNNREATKDKLLVYGVGINDADYMVTRYKNVNKKKQTIWRCPVYKAWVNMLRRCYSEKLKELNKTYVGVTACKEWHVFSNFRAWMIAQDFEGKELDKDILVVGNTIYSPETCAFVSHKVNSFFWEKGNKKTNYKRGVSLDKKTGKFLAACNIGNKKSVYLGSFKDPESAHLAWKSFKYKLAVELANEQTDKRIANAILSRFDLPPAPEGDKP